MKSIILIILVTIIMLPTTVTAQDDSPTRHHIAPCYNSATIPAHFTIIDYSKRLPMVFDSPHVTEFLALEGKQIEWLGYAPRSIPQYWLLERQGVQYGFGGINMDLLGETLVIMLNGERFTATPYADGKQSMVAHTTATQYARSDGTAYDYHIPAHPFGGACVWLVDADAVDTAIGRVAS